MEKRNKAKQNKSPSVLDPEKLREKVYLEQLGESKAGEVVLATEHTELPVAGAGNVCDDRQ